MEIGKFNAFRDKNNKYTIVVYRKDCPNSNRNLYKWDEGYPTYRASKKNNWECPDSIVRRMFEVLFPNEQRYKTSSVSSNKTSIPNSVKELLRKQAAMLKQQAAVIAEQAEIIADQAEIIISAYDVNSDVKDEIEIIEDTTEDTATEENENEQVAEFVPIVNNTPSQEQLQQYLSTQNNVEDEEDDEVE